MKKTCSKNMSRHKGVQYFIEQESGFGQTKFRAYVRIRSGSIGPAEEFHSGKYFGHMHKRREKPLFVVLSLHDTIEEAIEEAKRYIEGRG